MSTTEPRTVIEPYPSPGSRGVFEGDVVRIESEAGKTLAERRDPRSFLPGVRRRLWWDRLDALYFARLCALELRQTPLLLTGEARLHESRPR